MPVKNKSIGIIGAGNTAYFLLQKLSSHAVINIWNRNTGNSHSIKKKYPSVHVIDNFKNFKDDTDVFLIAVNDDAISDTINSCRDVHEKIFIHHSGNYNIDQDSGFKNTGVIWPVFSLVKTNVKTYNHHIPIVINASDQNTLNTVKTITEILSDNIYILDNEQKKHAHLIAVMSNNFINHLISQCQTIAEKEKIDFNMFLPIIHQTIEQLNLSKNLSLLQSGPAKRNDKKTIDSHLSLIRENTDLTSIYSSITQSIIDQYNQNEKRDTHTRNKK